jgi:uncharacterized integral membrane protein
VLSLLRKYGLVAYWLAFALYTTYMAQFPGLVRDLSRWRYPWSAVIVVWFLLAVFVAILHSILRPMTYRRSWGRLAGACAYSAALFVLGVLSIVTDAPGYYYVPAVFSVVTAGVMTALVLVTVGAAVVRKFRHAAWTGRESC